jgi:uncharacterized membrane protein
MKRLMNSFFQGLVVVGPLAITLYVCWAVFSTIDRWLGLPIPGAGFVLTIALITLVGFLATNLVTRGTISLVERVMARLPFLRLIYGSTKDLLDAFVGEKRRFDRPVLVSLTPGNDMRVLGFVTRDSLSALGLDGCVAVYIPQSYGWAGNVVIFTANRVMPVDVESADVMAFVVSGGVTGIGGAP